MPPGEILKSGALRVHSFSSILERKIRAFKQSTDIIKFWLLGGNFQRKVGNMK